MPPHKGPRRLSGDTVRAVPARRLPPVPMFTGVGLLERARRGLFMMTGHTRCPGRETAAPMCSPRSIIAGPSSATARGRGYHGCQYILYNPSMSAASPARQIGRCGPPGASVRRRGRLSVTAAIPVFGPGRAGGSCRRFGDPDIYHVRGPACEPSPRRGVMVARSAVPAIAATAVTAVVTEWPRRMERHPGAARRFPAPGRR